MSHRPIAGSSDCDCDCDEQTNTGYGAGVAERRPRWSWGLWEINVCVCVCACAWAPVLGPAGRSERAPPPRLRAAHPTPSAPGGRPCGRSHGVRPIISVRPRTRSCTTPPTVVGRGRIRLLSVTGVAFSARRAYCRVSLYPPITPLPVPRTSPTLRVAAPAFSRARRSAPCSFTHSLTLRHRALAATTASACPAAARHRARTPSLRLPLRQAAA